MSLEQHKIENLLERLGDQEATGDSVHRYELRRRLLCSSFFESDSTQAKCNRFLSYTAPLVAGGLLVAVFAFVGTNIIEQEEYFTKQTGGHKVAVEDLVDQSQQAFTFIDESDIFAGFIDFEQPVPANDVIRFIPMRNSEYMLVR